MDRRVFLRNSLLGFAAGFWGTDSLQHRAVAAGNGIIPPNQRPRVLIISDIKAGSGDPDDRQSLAHLVMYANEVDICGIWPDDMNSGVIASQIVLDRYNDDYNNSAYKFKVLDYPTPAYLRTKLFTSHNQAISTIQSEARRNDPRPIYVLVWGGTHRVPQFLAQLTAAERRKIRLISIGTYLLDNALANGDGRRYNWNAWGEARMNIWQRFPDVWWLEMDWTWMGMAFNEDFRRANEPVVLNDQLAQYAGRLGAHIKEVFPRYFRALDTNSLLYLLDPANNLDDPTKGSWAGKYHRPFANRPNYYIGIDGGHTWNYANPASTWNNATKVFIARIRTSISQRNAWHRAFTQKFMQLYGHQPLETAPTVSVGSDVTLSTSANAVTLSGSGFNTGCSIASYLWTQVRGPSTATLNGARTANLNATNLVPGTYTFRLTVTDVCGARATDDVNVTVASAQGPTANAGSNQTVTDTDGDGFERVVLDGTASRNGNGNIVSYVWQEGGTTLATTNMGSISVKLAVGVHQITLVVKDNKGATATDSLTITVNAGASTPEPEPEPEPAPEPAPGGASLYRAINLNGGAVSIDGVSFEGKNASNYSTVGRTHVTSTVPSPSVGNDRRAMLQSFIWGRPVSVALKSVPNGDYRVYLWVFEDNNTVTFSVKVNGSSVLTNRRSGGAGTWQRLDLGTATVTNGQLVVQGDLSRDALNISAIEVWSTSGTPSAPQNQSPVANAGPNQTVTSTNGGATRVVLNGTGSADRDGRLVSYAWKEGSRTLATTASASVDLAVGVHTITLTVTDDKGATSRDSVTITVNQPPAQEPTPPNEEPTPPSEEPDPPNETPVPAAGTLYRAINLNGGAVSVDGISFEGKNAPNYSTVGRTHVSRTIPNPRVNSNKQTLLQSFIWDRRVSCSMNSIPNGNYRVYLWIFEDNNPVTFSVNVNGRSAINNARSGAAGTWQRLDLGATTISNGQLVVQGNLSGDALNMCALEVWRA